MLAQPAGAAGEAYLAASHLAYMMAGGGKGDIALEKEAKAGGGTLVQLVRESMFQQPQLL